MTTGRVALYLEWLKTLEIKAFWQRKKVVDFLSKSTTLFGGGGESRTLGYGLAQIAALKRHWRFIHYRDQFSSLIPPPPFTNKTPPNGGALFVVEVGRVEHSPAGSLRSQL